MQAKSVLGQRLSYRLHYGRHHHRRQLGLFGLVGAAFSKGNRRNDWKAFKSFARGIGRKLTKPLTNCDLSSFDTEEWLEEELHRTRLQSSGAKIEEDHHNQMTGGTLLTPRLTVEMTELARKTLQLFEMFRCSANLQFIILL